jgi:hypothetical protein
LPASERLEAIPERADVLIERNNIVLEPADLPAPRWLDGGSATVLVVGAGTAAFLALALWASAMPGMPKHIAAAVPNHAKRFMSVPQP